MEARFFRIALATIPLVLSGAGYRTENFIVSAPSVRLEKEIGQAAEHYRKSLAKEWLGYELPRWDHPCPIRAYLAAGAGGETSFVFDNGRAHSWRMTIQGSRERLLDSVLPHEITHTIFATHFGRPLPRWVDEGACTTVEHDSEKSKQQANLIHFLTHKRGIAFNRMFAMSEYPEDILPLYAQGYSLSKFLIAQGGRQRLVRYIGDGMKRNDWTAATKKHYGFKNLSELQLTWLDWVRHGSLPISPQTLSPREGTMLASNRGNRSTPSSSRPHRAEQRIIRGQNSDHKASSDRQLVPVPPASSNIAVAETSKGTQPLRQPAASSGSWYARGQNRSTTPQRVSHEESFARVKTKGDNSPGKSNDHSTAHPRPIEKSRQIILEWSRTRPWSPGTTTRLATENFPQAIYDTSTLTTDSLLR